MWSSRPSTSTSSSSSHEKAQLPPSSFSHHRRAESARQGREPGVDEDVWNLEDSDGEESGAAAGHHDNIARVAAQAGLGRKASSSSLNLAAPAPVALGSSSSSNSLNSAYSSAKSPPSAAALHVAASLGGAVASPKASTSSSSGTVKMPPGTGKDRARQPSYGFWERLSGIGAAVGAAASSASGRDKERERDDLSSSYSSSGYARFDEDVQLEDNFDGTYSVNTSSSSGTASGSNKLLAPANIHRPSLGGSGALSSGKIPTLASNGKGKSKSLDAPGTPGNATIVGTPRPRSPLARRDSQRPRDEADMQRAVRKDVEDIMKDPVNLLKALSLSTSASAAEADPPLPSSALANASASDYYNAANSPPQQTSSSFVYDSPGADISPDPAAAAADLAKTQAQARRDASRKDKFIECLKKDTVDIAELRKLAWAGIPHQLRPIAWQLLLGYLPSPSSRRVSVLARKRQEYADAVRSAFARGESSLDAALWHQIQIDVPRTNPGVPLWQFASTQRSLEKILYVWAIRHPASGYVQGINDLATPFFQVFLSSYIDCDPEDYDIAALPPHVLSAIEADTFWCLSKLLDGIQDNYIFAQPGIHRQVARCQELCTRVDAPLAKHLEDEGVSFLQFSFRWFHLLFLRVLPVNSVIRMWDTYMSEGSDAFANFHIYVCLAFLLRWSEKLRSMDFQGIMLFLQEPVNHEMWSESMTELLLSEGFMWSALFAGSK